MSEQLERENAQLGKMLRKAIDAFDEKADALTLAHKVYDDERAEHAETVVELEQAESACAAYRSFLLTERNWHGFREEFLGDNASGRNFKKLEEWLVGHDSTEIGHDYFDRLNKAEATLADARRHQKNTEDTLRAFKNQRDDARRALVELDDEERRRNNGNRVTPISNHAHEQIALAQPKACTCVGFTDPLCPTHGDTNQPLHPAHHPKATAPVDEELLHLDACVYGQCASGCPIGVGNSMSVKGVE